jgi:hypothetical protein
MHLKDVKGYSPIVISHSLRRAASPILALVVDVSKTVEMLSHLNRSDWRVSSHIELILIDVLVLGPEIRIERLTLCAVAFTGITHSLIAF